MAFKCPYQAEWRYVTRERPKKNSARQADLLSMFSRRAAQPERSVGLAVILRLEVCFSKIIVLFGRNSSSDPILTATENTGRKLADFAGYNMYMSRHLDFLPTRTHPSMLLVTNSTWLRLKNTKKTTETLAIPLIIMTDKYLIYSHCAEWRLGAASLARHNFSIMRPSTWNQCSL